MYAFCNIDNAPAKDLAVLKKDGELAGFLKSFSTSSFYTPLKD